MGEEIGESKMEDLVPESWFQRQGEAYGNKNSSEDEIANVNFLRRYRMYVLQNTKKENLLRLTN